MHILNIGLQNIEYRCNSAKLLLYFVVEEISNKIFLAPLLGIGIGIYVRMYMISFDHLVFAIALSILCFCGYSLLHEIYFDIFARNIFHALYPACMPFLRINICMLSMLICFVFGWAWIGHLAMSIRINGIKDDFVESQRILDKCNVNVKSNQNEQEIDHKPSKAIVDGDDYNWRYAINKNNAHRRQKYIIIGQIAKIDIRNKKARVYFRNPLICSISDNNKKGVGRIRGYIRVNTSMNLDQIFTLSSREVIGRNAALKIYMTRDRDIDYLLPIDLRRMDFFRRIILRGYTNSRLLLVSANSRGIIHYDQDVYHLNSSKTKDVRRSATAENKDLQDYIMHINRDELSFKILFIDRIERLRMNIVRQLYRAFEGKGEIAGLIIAMMIGESSFVSDSMYDKFRTAGILHLIAISGMHIATIAAIVFFAIFKVASLFPRILTIFPAQKIASCISMLLLVGYFLISGMSISALRALICSLIAMTCFLRDSSACFERILNLSGVFILLAIPEDLFSPGLQLSLMSCCGIVCGSNMYRSLLRRLRNRNNRIEESIDCDIENRIGIEWSHRVNCGDKGVKADENMTLDQDGEKEGAHKGYWQVVKRLLNKIILYGISLIITSIIISIFTFGLVILHFGTFPHYGLFANIICIPLCDLIIMPMSILSLCEVLLGMNTRIASKVVEISAQVMIDVASYFADLSFTCIDIREFNSYLWWMIFGILPIFATFARGSKTRNIICGIISLSIVGSKLVKDIEVLGVHSLSKPTLLILPEEKFFAIKIGDFCYYNSNRDSYIAKLAKESLRDYDISYSDGQGLNSDKIGTKKMIKNKGSVLLQNSHNYNNRYQDIKIREYKNLTVHYYFISYIDKFNSAIDCSAVNMIVIFRANDREMAEIYRLVDSARYQYGHLAQQSQIDTRFRSQLQYAQCVFDARIDDVGMLDPRHYFNKPPEDIYEMASQTIHLKNSEAINATDVLNADSERKADKMASITIRNNRVVSLNYICTSEDIDCNDSLSGRAIEIRSANLRVLHGYKSMLVN